jgi:hypothetical protein
LIIRAKGGNGKPEGTHSLLALGILALGIFPKLPHIKKIRMFRIYDGGFLLGMVMLHC